jgi:hypothetical protein
LIITPARGLLGWAGCPRRDAVSIDYDNDNDNDNESDSDNDNAQSLWLRCLAPSLGRSGGY